MKLRRLGGVFAATLTRARGAGIRFNGRSCRGFHFWPRVYPGIASAQYRSAVLGLKPTSLLCWLVWSWEVIP